MKKLIRATAVATPQASAVSTPTATPTPSQSITIGRQDLGNMIADVLLAMQEYTNNNGSGQYTVEFGKYLSVSSTPSEATTKTKKVVANAVATKKVVKAEPTTQELLDNLASDVKALSGSKVSESTYENLCDRWEALEPLCEDNDKWERKIERIRVELEKISVVADDEVADIKPKAKVKPTAEPKAIPTKKVAKDYTFTLTDDDDNEFVISYPQESWETALSFAENDEDFAKFMVCMQVKKATYTPEGGEPANLAFLHSGYKKRSFMKFYERLQEVYSNAGLELDDDFCSEDSAYDLRSFANGKHNVYPTVTI